MTPSPALRRLRPLVAAALAGAALGAVAQPRYTLADLGTLPGYTDCVAHALNGSGDAVGHCAATAGGLPQVGFAWRSGVMSSTGLLGGGNYSTATAINALGVVAGDGDTGNGRPQSWALRGGSLVNIFPNNGGNTHALFVADSGWIGGYYTKSLSGSTSSWKGAIWTPDPKDPRKWRTTDLPVLPGGVDAKATSSIPWAFNQLGQAAGYATNDQIGQHAALWQADAAHTVIDLGVYPGDWSSLAYGLNDFGQAVGSSHPPFGSRPVLWNNDPTHTALELPVPAGDNQGAAVAINTLGHVIGSTWYGTPGTWDRTPGRLVVWRDAGVFPLQELLDPASAAGCTLASVEAINNRGQIAGSATCGGRLRPVVLTPVP